MYGRAIALPPASALAPALAKRKSFTLKFFYVMGKALSFELLCARGQASYAKMRHALLFVIVTLLDKLHRAILCGKGASLYALNLKSIDQSLHGFPVHIRGL